YDFRPFVVALMNSLAMAGVPLLQCGWRSRQPTGVQGGCPPRHGPAVERSPVLAACLVRVVPRTRGLHPRTAVRGSP
ncbi:MAG: hypothetical protein ACK5EN_13040, partial [Planctomyces sp.]